ncbi:MAG TPA: adenosine deaminase [Opitutaceae bacterium]
MKETSPASLETFIQALPKTETHLHIEGSVPYDELLRTLDPKLYPANPEFRQRGYRYVNFPDFEQILLRHALPWYTSAERYHEAARVIFANHVRQNVRYVETSFHLHVTEFIHVPGPEIIEAILSAAPPGLEVRVFAGMLRTAYDGPLRAAIDEMHDWEDLAGVDLHGLETMPTEPWSFRVWEKMRKAGKVTKCHAGEFDGPAKVREAIQQLGVKRVQHGVRSIEDPGVMKLAADMGVTFDTCPLSNVGLCVYPDIASHPLRRLMQAGINCTVSTDDPLSFANSVSEEYEALATQGGFTRAELAQVARNGWAVADIGETERRAWLAEIDRVVAL